jgi:hypothetical protein
MTYSNKHLSDRPLSPEQQPVARGCCLTAFVTLFAVGSVAVVTFIGGLPAW